MWRAYTPARLPGLLLRRDRRGQARRNTWSGLLGGLMYLTGSVIMVYNLWPHHARAMSASASPTPASDRPMARPRRPGGRGIGAHSHLEASRPARAQLAAPAHRHHHRRLHRRPRRDRPAVLPREHHREGAGRSPLHPARAGGARHLHLARAAIGCHSQMIRPLRDEVERYGHYSLAAESMYDHPFLWGSKRTGPDLARVGGKYSDGWQRDHLIEPARRRAGVGDAALRLPGRPGPRLPRHRGQAEDHAGAGRALHPGRWSTTPRPTSRPRPSADASATGLKHALRRQDQPARFRRQSGPHHRDGRPDRLSADAGDQRRLLDLPRRAARQRSMSYETISQLAQQGGSVYFLLIFIGVCVYAFWPRNKAEFDKAARAALDEEDAVMSEPREKDAHYRHRDHRPRVGRHQGAGHPAAALVAVDLLRLHRLRRSATGS